MATRPDDHEEFIADRMLASVAVAFVVLTFGVPLLLAALQ